MIEENIETERVVVERLDGTTSIALIQKLPDHKIVSMIHLGNGNKAEFKKMLKSTTLVYEEVPNDFSFCKGS